MSLDETAAHDAEQVVIHPAGADNELRKALQDLLAGRWMAMRNLLVDEGGWGRWTYRTQVLGAAAAGSDVVDAWLAEDPESGAGRVMRARVAVERAMRARRIRHAETTRLWREAEEACAAAAQARPQDPVPWVCRLALAPLDEWHQVEEYRQTHPDPMLCPGPWGLLAEADRRDPGNREAYHRAMQFLGGLGGHAQMALFARWAADHAPPGSPLLVLPLYVHAERWRESHPEGGDHALDLHWVQDGAIRDAERGVRRWFDLSDPAERSLMDANYLAHALWAAHRFDDAARVFHWMGRYATARPWQYRIADPGRTDLVAAEFARIRRHCLGVAQGDAGRRLHRPSF
ncbi:hypothetical protein [Streptomyces sp. SAJ15]|uniref:hypothetical protein n=1 Tax=Streptomyces sp. SAJ15 TaxID=2011095 RepID=UPI001184FBCE|nr:hypothetical protein [Streptomyces sp. SAJ15]TVL94223.1 hypothetical protein CD790_04335 [Streptomyces sp. SAJ15]